MEDRLLQLHKTAVRPTAAQALLHRRYGLDGVAGLRQKKPWSSRLSCQVPAEAGAHSRCSRGSRSESCSCSEELARPHALARALSRIVRLLPPRVARGVESFRLRRRRSSCPRLGGCRMGARRENGARPSCLAPPPAPRKGEEEGASKRWMRLFSRGRPRTPPASSLQIVGLGVKVYV